MHACIREIQSASFAVLSVVLFAGAAFGQAEAQPGAGTPPLSTPRDVKPDLTSMHEYHPEPWHRDDIWTVRIEPGISYSGLAGDLTLPRATAGVNRSIKLRDLDMDEPRIAPFAEVNLRRGDWRISARGLVFSAENDATAGSNFTLGGVPFLTGNAISSEVDFSSFEIEGGYTLLKNALRARTAGGFTLRPRLDVVAGVRIVDMDWSVQNVTAGSPARQADQVFVHPTVGLKGSIEVSEQFTLDVQLSGGTLPLDDTESSSVDILVGGSWKPWPNFGVQAGYRALFLTTTDGEDQTRFEFDGTSQGLYAGIVLEF